MPRRISQPCWSASPRGKRSPSPSTALRWRSSCHPQIVAKGTRGKLRNGFAPCAKGQGLKARPFVNSSKKDAAIDPLCPGRLGNALLVLRKPGDRLLGSHVRETGSG